MHGYKWPIDCTRTRTDQIREARRLLKVWAPLTPTQALDLLEARHADLRVREHAVQALERLSDTELELYMPQLIQVRNRPSDKNLFLIIKLSCPPTR